MQNTDGAIQLVVGAFATQCNRLTKTLSEFSVELLLEQVAPGRNTGLYLLAHLVTVNDSMLPILGLGEKQYPELENVFGRAPDRSVIHHYKPEQVRNMWLMHTDLLIGKLSALSNAEWMDRHLAISPEDFVQQPHRNKLNVLINRTNHLAYHAGQLAFLKKM